MSNKASENPKENYKENPKEKINAKPEVSLVLASQSQGRLSLLAQMGFVPNVTLPSHINEEPLKKEKPKETSFRLAKEKATFVIDMIKKGEISNSDAANLADTFVILGGDTVVAKKNIVADKAENDEDVRKNMEILSGGSHRIFSSYYVAKVAKVNGVYELMSETHGMKEARVVFKHLTKNDIESMVASKAGIGKAGGYTINSLGESFATKMSGCPSVIMGMPSYQVRNALLSFGVKPTLF